MDRKKIRNDIFLIVSLLVVAVVSLVVVLATRRKADLIAKVYVNNEVVEVIDLSKNEDKDYPITGINGELLVHTHDGAIAVIKSNCPHQDCVHMGYVSETNRPIICAYNAVYIVIEGASSSDVVI